MFIIKKTKKLKIKWSQQKKELEEKSLKLKSYETIPKNENEQHEVIKHFFNLKK